MKELPKIGLYISTRKTVGMRLVIEDVFGPDEDELEDDEHYLINVIDEASKDDYSAMGNEMDNHEWQALVEEYGFVHEDDYPHNVLR
ncbi:hypothetical protein [Aeromonas enteropelogenes]|uniref:hypothetical protein n=1 Tax=Aeromonas enteropelogenes TaxID=29489 RepID=UPI003BA1465D